MEESLNNELKGLDSDKVISKYQLEVSQKAFSNQLLNGLGDEIINSFTTKPNIKKSTKVKYKIKNIFKSFFNLF